MENSVRNWEKIQNQSLGTLPSWLLKKKCDDIEQHTFLFGQTQVFPFLYSKVYSKMIDFVEQHQILKNAKVVHQSSCGSLKNQLIIIMKN